MQPSDGDGTRRCDPTWPDLGDAAGLEGAAEAPDPQAGSAGHRRTPQARRPAGLGCFPARARPGGLRTALTRLPRHPRRPQGRAGGEDAAQQPGRRARLHLSSGIGERRAGAQGERRRGGAWRGTVRPETTNQRAASDLPGGGAETWGGAKL